jgi:hypothetical protein
MSLPREIKSTLSPERSARNIAACRHTLVDGLAWREGGYTERDIRAVRSTVLLTSEVTKTILPY